MFRTLRLSGVLTLLCLATGIAGAQLTYNQTFVSHPTNGPGGLSAADVNRDGKPDLTYVHGSALSVQFGSGAGTYGAPHDTALPGTESNELRIADVNKDGKLDAVIAEGSPAQVLVLLGNGDGTFAAPITFSLVNIPYAMQLGDINKDGNVDIAVRECQSAGQIGSPCDVAVYLGTGTGAFTPSSTIDTPGAATYAHSLVLSDLNRDGKLDVAVAELKGTSAAPTVTLAIFSGHGDGTFSLSKSYTVPFSVPADYVAVPPTWVAGDFNGDGVDDIGVDTGVACGGSACGTATMHVYINNGAGGFGQHSSFQSAINDGPSDWIAADLNNDLKIDLMRINASVHTGSVRTYLNNGYGTFSEVSNPDGGYTVAFGEVRDVNLDGRHDFLTEDWDFGDSDLTAQMNTNGTPNCAPPPSGALHAKICTPSGTSVSSTTFTVKASGNSPVGVKRLELWIDGTKRAEVLNDQLRKTVTLSAGSHTLTVVAVDKYLGAVKTTKTISVP